jgi:hypothetical protein
MSIKKKNFTNNLARGEKIKTKLKEKVGKPIIAYGYFNSMSELKESLGISNVEINKANARNGAVRGFKIIKQDVSNALTKLVDLNQFK